jgi:hypothetical protein
MQECNPPAIPEEARLQTAAVEGGEAIRLASTFLASRTALGWFEAKPYAGGEGLMAQKTPGGLGDSVPQFTARAVGDCRLCLIACNLRHRDALCFVKCAREGLR